MDSANPQRLWTATNYMYRTDDGANNWVKASTDFGIPASAIAVSPTNGNHVLAGFPSGHIVRTTIGSSANSTTVWNATLPQAGYVSWIAFDPNNANVVYATYSTFGVTKVWRSANGGANWTALGSAGLPDIPVHSIIVHPTDSAKLYIGTDAGVFYSANTGASWSPENTGFPNTVVESLAIANFDSNPLAAPTPHLYAFTHGRGVFRVSLAAPSATSVQVAGKVTASGRGLRNARVTLTDTNGNSRTLLTGTFGNFRFTDVQIGQTVTIEVFAKKYTFNPQVVTVTDEITDLNFSADEPAAGNKNPDNQKR